MKSSLFKKKPMLAAIFLAAAVPGVGHAALEEIIVTANKRAESANDIGLSISAISGDKLAEQKLTTLEEITQSVPGLNFATSQQNTPILVLRGVGFNESSLGVYPATSLYVDEIPLPFPAMASHSAYDLERAEVLKGPQGVLFGQNSTGGAINFIAAKPTEELSYGGDVSYGKYNKIETNAFVSGALSETVAARLAVQNVTADDWQESVTTNDENGEEDYTAARLSLRFQPTDAAEINFNLNGWRDKSDPQALQFIAATPKTPTGTGLANATNQFNMPFADKDAESADWSAADKPKGDKEFMQASLRGDFDVSENMTLTALAAYSDYEQDQRQDGDGTTLLTAGYEFNEGDIESTFLEVRLAGDADNVRWVVGANYEDSSTSEEQLLNFLDNTSNRFDTFFVHRLGSALEQDIESYAAFGNLEFDLTDAVTLKVGARYTDTTIEANSCNYSAANAPGQPDAASPPVSTILLGVVPGLTADSLVPGSNVASIFNYLGSITGRPFERIGEGDCFSLDDVPTAGVPGIPYVDELSEDNVSWRVGLDFQITEDTLVYANVSQGYKAGSFPVLAAFTHIELAPVTEESVLAYEVGFKSSLADSRVQWNGAIFHYDYEDKQVRGKVDLPLFGALDRLVNIPESTITGIETDIVAQLTDNLTLTAAVTYVDSEAEEYPQTLGGQAFGFDAYGINRDLSGNSLPLTPEWTYSLDLDYRVPLANGGVLFMGTNVIGQSDADAVFDGDDLNISMTDDFPTPLHKSITENYFVIEEYYTVGARLGYESEDGRWRVMLWGKNLTDEYYWNSVIASSEGGARVAGRPRTYGITLGYRY